MKISTNSSVFKPHHEMSTSNSSSTEKNSDQSFPFKTLVDNQPPAAKTVLEKPVDDFFVKLAAWKIYTKKQKRDVSF